MSARVSVGASALLYLSFALVGCGQPAKSAEKQPIPVKVQKVEARAGAGIARYSGSLEPNRKVDMAFRVGGYVEALGEVAGETGKRAIDKGDFVTKGTVLARVRSSDYVQKLKTAEAQLSEARAQRVLADEDLVRARRLYDGKAITKAELDAKIAKADSARAQVEGAQAQSGEVGVSLSDTVLRAPMDGVILSRPVEIGKLVSPGEPAISIADVKTVKAVFGAPQLLVEKLSVGTEVMVYVGAESEAKSPDKLLHTQISRIAPSADSNGRVFSVEAALPNPTGELRPGTVVSVRIPDSQAANTRLVVPLSSVIRSPKDPQGFSVFVLDGAADRGRTRLRGVSLGEVVGNGVTVTGGITENDRVVITGASLLRDGGDAVVIR
jgi:RND family efflux transporter MFP subunit